MDNRFTRHVAVALVLLSMLALVVQPAPAQAAAPRVDAALAARLAQGGTAPFWIMLNSQADLSPRALPNGWTARGSAVVARLKDHAARSQARVLASLRLRDVTGRAFWAANAILVNGDETLLRFLARQPDVGALLPDTPRHLADDAELMPAILATGLWNLDQIHAGEAWAAYESRGAGIVVGVIDTGVDYTHPALVSHYRGALPQGGFAHAYNWFDPTGGCPGVPCDTHGHGTHVTGSIAGARADGAVLTGVAPGAQWIAARGCAGNICAEADLLAAGEWMLAPTDASGLNPRPDLRPDLVNNSWGGREPDPFFRQIEQAWLAAGILPVFAAGNNEPGCGVTLYPAAYPESLAVGATDAQDQLAGFSNRGPSPADGSVKPDLSAPGVDILSSVPGGGYAFGSGTSMAAPHVSGAVAVLWSAFPALRHDIARTRFLLEGAAHPLPADDCGGETSDNNAFGHGRLDLLAAGGLQSLQMISTYLPSVTR